MMIIVGIAAIITKLTTGTDMIRSLTANHLWQYLIITQIWIPGIIVAYIFDKKSNR